MTERMESQIQAAEISFLSSVSDSALIGSHTENEKWAKF